MSRDYNQSPKDILNGPYNMHYICGPHGKKVSNHLMKDCRTFLWLEGAFGIKESEAQTQGYIGTPGSVSYNTPPPPPLPANGAAPTQAQQTTNNQNDGYIASKGQIMAMIQPMPKLRKI
jgi:hypothetical protein